jgi:hypothetical protein
MQRSQLIETTAFSKKKESKPASVVLPSNHDWVVIDRALFSSLDLSRLTIVLLVTNFSSS